MVNFEMDNKHSGFCSDDVFNTQKRDNRFNQRVFQIREDTTMRALISLTIIAAFLMSANSTWKKIERDFAPQAIASAKASVDRMNGSITSAVTKTATTANPFTTITAKTEATATINSNPTPTEIIVQKNCSGMDCYRDLEVQIPVIVASNIN